MHFTGHSLGGLLAPAMALWLLDCVESRSRKDLAAKLRLDVYGYAAPTAGNRAFADYLSSRLPGNRRYANDLDIATLAWEEEAMRRMARLYEPGIKTLAITKSLIALCAKLCEGKSYAQPGERIAVPADLTPNKRRRFLVEAAYQHCMPYLDMLPPDRKEAILRDVVRPLADLVSLKGLKSIDLQRLLKDFKLPSRRRLPFFSKG
jgi:hypothetical protein